MRKIYADANKIWKELHNDISDQDLTIDIKAYENWLDLFHINSYYYFVFNIKKGDFDLVSSNILDVLGYTQEEFTVPLLLSKIHPDDQAFFLNFENKVVSFFAGLSVKQIPNYKVSYDYRVLTKRGDYKRILQQVLTINYDTQGRILRTLGVHTDISLLKQNGIPKLSFIGINGEPSFYNVNVKEVFKASIIQLTKREREVLLLLIDGLTSTTISIRLDISKQTVDKHRKNLMSKLDCVNTLELISKALQQGLI